MTFFSKINTVKVLLHTLQDLCTYSQLEFTLRKIYDKMILSQCHTHHFLLVKFFSQVNTVKSLLNMLHNLRTYSQLKFVLRKFFEGMILPQCHRQHLLLVKFFSQINTVKSPLCANVIYSHFYISV